MSVFLMELYGHNLLLTVVFGVVVAGSVLIFGVLIGDWVGRKPRNKGGQLRAVITLVALANLAGTALTITVQRDWIVSLTGDNRGQLAGMDAAVRLLDQIINTLAPLSAGQGLPTSSPTGCKIPAKSRGHFLERQQKAVNIQGAVSSWETTGRFFKKPKTSEKPKERRTNFEGQQATTTGSSLCLQSTRRVLPMCREGWEAYCWQTVFPAGLGLAFLYMTVLGFDCITTGYAYTQGIGGSLLSILTALSALSGLMGTVLFTRLRGHYGLVTTGVISSWLHIGCLMLCVFSVFAPGSPFDLAVFSLPLSTNSSPNCEVLKEDQVHTYFFERNMNQPILPDRSSLHWTNSTVLFEGEQDPEYPESYISIILLFSGVILARIGLWSFDLIVTQLLQENIPEMERGAVNGMQCSLNYLMDLIHSILVMLAPRPQQFGMLVFISVLFVTTGHVLYFFYTRKCKMRNAHVQKTEKKDTLT